ncbi:hypothetical protein M6D81_11960 [Paenibacillus sp. J5C_2022]|uniref:hypothetical protein n=1 Tax=Paenibacillus sp. J5C2022 TaxID=2977129 RepID=UPI0021D1A0C3|nr:hypothetical protein [Paenibacillus sp. J5C2022]MCU6709420.1 hypothetical protein [Paenibacillus sp. J5C2022]
MSNVQVFKNELFEVAARESGMNVEFDAETVTKALGWIQHKNGREYVRWERLNGFLSDFDYSPSVGKGDFIPEQYVYLLLMKAENDVAVSFQRFIAFDVIPAIRKNKVYIDPSATDKEIDAAVRFATPQKRRNALLDATIDGKSSVFAVYDDIKSYINKWTADEKITVLLHIERVLTDKQVAYGNDVAFVHKIEELLRQVAKDLDKVKNWKNGAVKRGLSKENKKLKEQIDYLNPEIENMYKVNIHPFSENYMYELVTFGGMTVQRKSKAYLNWISKFPVSELPDIFELDVDFNKPVELICHFDHMDKFDVINLDKSFADMLAFHYGFNDNVIKSSTQETNRHVGSYAEGKIYFMLRNV